MLFPLASVTVNITVFAPTFEQVNVLGETLNEAIPQASVEPLFTWAPVILTVPAEFNWTVMFCVITVGTIVSITVTVTEAVDELLFASVAVNVTVLAPVFEHVNEFGLAANVNPPQASVDPLFNWAPVIETAPAAFKYALIFFAVATGAVTSWIVTVAKPDLLFPFASVTVKVTVLAPTFEQVNVFGETLKVAIPQASVEPLFTWDAVIDAFPEAFNWTVMFWVVTIGTMVSITVTVAVAVDELLLPSVTVNVTVFAPVLEQTNVLGETE